MKRLFDRIPMRIIGRTWDRRAGAGGGRRYLMEHAHVDPKDPRLSGLEWGPAPDGCEWTGPWVSEVGGDGMPGVRHAAGGTYIFRPFQPREIERHIPLGPVAESTVGQ